MVPESYELDLDGFLEAKRGSVASLIIVDGILPLTRVWWLNPLQYNTHLKAT